MSLGFGIYIQQGNGTKTTASTGSRTISVTLTGATGSGGACHVAVVYVVYDSAPSRPGYFYCAEPWQVLAYGYNAASLSALYVVALISPWDYPGGSTFTLSDSTDATFAATCQNNCFLRPLAASGGVTFCTHFRYELPKTVNRGSTYFVSASSTTLTCPAAPYPYPQGLDIACGGYNNGGTTTTIGVVAQGAGASAYTERFDTGQTSPPHGVFLDQRLAYGFCALGTNNATLAAAKTNKWGARVFIPIVGNVIGNSRRYMSHRRLF